MMASGVGFPHSDVARLIGISEGSLRTYFRTELDQGWRTSKPEGRRSFVKLAIADPPLPMSATAAIWWTKACMGWKETSRVENTGADGKPIETTARWLSSCPTTAAATAPCRSFRGASQRTGGVGGCIACGREISTLV